MIFRVSSPLRGASRSAMVAPMKAPRVKNRAFSPVLLSSLIDPPRVQKLANCCGGLYRYSGQSKNLVCVGTPAARGEVQTVVLRVAAEPGPRYRASGAAAARPGGRLARPPLPPQAALAGPGRCWRPSTMHIDIACGPPPSIWPRGARNAALCTFTTDSWSPHGGLPSRDGIILRLRAAFHRFNAPASAGTILRSRKSRKEPTAAPIGVL